MLVYKSVMDNDNGGGSSYTAGDGIDITNDIISTKQSEEGDIDEIVDVYPQAGNLVSIVNAFNKGDIYSTSEKMIGQWTDGKPLYQKYCTKTATNIDESLNGSNDHPRTIYTKTYTAPATVILRNIVAYTDVSSNDGYIVIKKNSEQLLKMYIISDKNTTYDGEVSFSMATGDVLTVEGNWDNTHTNIKWKLTADCYEYDIADAELFFEKVPNVLNYTKTTDTSISIGETIEYSTDEKVVGTWVDGKPIYQCTYNIGTLNLGTTWGSPTLDFTIDRLINAIGCGEAIEDKTSKDAGAVVFPVHGIGSFTYDLSVKASKENNKFVVYSSAGNITQILNAYLTVQYTKTTT